jgi:hypothetical protein
MVKKVTQAAINSGKPLVRVPKGARKTIPKQFSLADILAAVKNRHPEIYQHFGSGIGMKIMRVESDILVQVLLILMDKGIIALPVHDAILVNANYEDEAKEVMVEVFRKRTDLLPDVSVEHP